jgi:hypothetical protein
MSFHKNYSNLTKQLPASLIQRSWDRLTTRKKNSLSIDEVQSINPIVEDFLKHEIKVYNQTKQRYRINKPHISDSMDSNLSIAEQSSFGSTSIVKPCISDPIDTNHLSNSFKPIYTAEEFNLRIKNTLDDIQQKFYNTTKETLISIKKQKGIEMEQLRKDIEEEMAGKTSILFENTLKKYIRDGRIYTLIHDLEVMDGKNYSNSKAAL